MMRPCCIICELSKLFALDLLNVHELLILRFLHAAHLACKFNLGEECNLMFATLCFEVIQLFVALFEIIFHHPE